ncbi:MAG TPA: 4Fe-4S ferredoxin, partial [Methylomirabilota bacterium]|nr:4Fe-4S ferredoxin [Methylomirabilota bacterium]
ARAARLLTHGRLRLPLWAGVALGGIVLPGILLLNPALPAASVTAALLALGGLWLWEELWVRAGQAIPLS